MRSRTLRRKLQKKAKHKPYRKCPVCGLCMVMVLRDGDPPDAAWQLFKVCGEAVRNGRRIGRFVYGCGYSEELFWSGGGTGRHIPH